MKNKVKIENVLDSPELGVESVAVAVSDGSSVSLECIGVNMRRGILWFNSSILIARYLNTDAVESDLIVSRNARISFKTRKQS